MAIFTSKMCAHGLHNSEMKKLARIFRKDHKEKDGPKHNQYSQRTKEDIADLPRRLRSPILNLSSTNLCSTHKGLDSRLVNDIFAWVHYELDVAIGKFLYPLIMTGALTADQEQQVRQLEPVREMWHSDFTAETSALPGFRHFQAGRTWKYQVGQCPACMLTRIGSNETVLFAIFAGMIGRLQLGRSGIDPTIESLGCEQIKSKRLRFVRYWILRFRRGDIMLTEACRLGLEMKARRNVWKAEVRRLRAAESNKTPSTPAAKSTNEAEHGRRSVRQRGSVFSDIAVDITDPFQPKEFSIPAANSIDEVEQEHRSVGRPTSVFSDIGVDITDPFQPKEFSYEGRHDPKIGPQPRPSNVEHLSPLSSLGFTRPRLPGTIPSIDHAEASESARVFPTSQRSTASGISAAHLGAPPNRPRIYQQSRQARVESFEAIPEGCESSVSSLSQPPQRSVKSAAPSLLSTYTVSSLSSDYNSLNRTVESRYDPLNHPIYNTPLIQQQNLEKYREICALRPWSDDHDAEDDVVHLPIPRPASMYSAFGNIAFDGDAYVAFDEEPEAGQERCNEEECEEQCGAAVTRQLPGARPGQSSAAKTVWDDLY